MQGGVSSFSSLTCLGCAWPKFWKRTQLTMTWASGGRWSSQYELAHISHRNSRPPAACAEHGASAQTPGHQAPGTRDTSMSLPSCHVLQSAVSCASHRAAGRCVTPCQVGSTCPIACCALLPGKNAGSSTRLRITHKRHGDILQPLKIVSGFDSNLSGCISRCTCSKSAPASCGGRRRRSGAGSPSA